jgi:hypothetical protein
MVEKVNLESYARELAERAYSNVVGQAEKDKYSIDPMTILAIVSMIIKVIEFIYDWYNGNSDRSAKSIKKMNTFKKFILWRYVRAGAENRQEAGYIYNSLLDLVYNLSDEERKKLFILARQK